jgi:thiol:disulfide interchange protein
MKSFWVSAFLLFSFMAMGQVLKPVSWTWDSKQVGDNEFDIIFKSNMKDGWAIYSQFLEPGGPQPTTFTYDSPKDLQLVGKAKESGPKKKEGHDDLFDMNVTKFLGEATFVQRVKVKDSTVPIEGYLTFMTCNDSQCLPPTDVDFSIKLKTEAKPAETPKPVAPVKESPKPAETTKPSTTTATATKPSETSKPSNTSTTTTVKPSESKKPDSKPTTTGTTAKPTEGIKTKPTENSEQLVPVAPVSGTFKPVKWIFDHEKISDTEYELHYKASIDKGWYVYSQYLESDDGPNATVFEFDSKDNLELLGKIEEKGNVKTDYDKIFGMNVTKLSGDVTFSQKVKLLDASKPALLSGNVIFQACDKDKCLPPEEQAFSFRVSSGNAPDEASAAPNGQGVFKIEGETIDQQIPNIVATYAAPTGDCGTGAVVKSNSWWKTFFFGFLGGLLALLTPCVFPMLPLTVSFFTKDTKRSGLANALIYGLSIIAIYVGIGLLITTVAGPTALNELSVSWIANTIFFVVFLLFAFSFFGYYEITLPSSWSNKSDKLADKGGLLGIFFMAATLAIVSFSCTGPIIGTALVESAKNPAGPSIVMLGFATALAIPFGFFAAFPAWLNSLPRSGSWMNSVKVVIGFIELALAFKFLSVADMTSHWGILGYEIFMGIWVLLAAAMTLYLFGFIKFPHDSPIQKLSKTRFFFGLASLALTIYLGSGFLINAKTNTYNSLSLLSGLAPPAQYNYLLKKAEPDPAIKAKYPSFSKCANGLDCFKDYEEGLAYAKERNKPILIDFTGHGCVNCRKMEEHVWVKDDVWKKLNNDYVLVSLYVDDKTPLETPLVSKTQGKKLRNVGHIWADFQIVNFNQNSQPLYVLMDNEQNVLAEPIGYDQGKDPKAYLSYLECGLATFRAEQ